MTPKILLEQYRKKLNMKKIDFAVHLWVSNSTMSNILNEKYYPNYQTIEIICSDPELKHYKEEFLNQVQKRKAGKVGRKKWKKYHWKYITRKDREDELKQIKESVEKTKQLIRKTMPPCRPFEKIGNDFFFEKEKKITAPIVNKSYEDYLLDDFKKWKITRSEYEGGIKRFNLAKRGVYVDV